MALFKIGKSPYWQIRFEIAGLEVRRSAGTRDRRAAQEFEEQLRSELWRRIKLGEQNWTWADALAKCELEDSHQRSWDRTQRSLKILNEYISPDTPLAEIDYEALIKIRSLLQLRTLSGHGWKSNRLWKASTCNRVLAVAGSILARCASDEWKHMISRAPKVPLFALGKSEPKWITREQAHTLLGRFPLHTRDMAIFALATGLRKSNVAGLEWDRIDLERRCCYVPGYLTKSGEPIPVPLNGDAIAVLARWDAIHEKKRGQWPTAVHRYVFVYRGRAPIHKLTTRMWRRECKAAGLEGVTFHSMRHAWASWQIQAKTPLRILQELGGWATIDMPLRYAHLDPGHLADYADRTLLSADPRRKSVTLEGELLESDSQVTEFIGKGGTRTLDPGIMSAVL
jgi:integrase